LPNKQVALHNGNKNGIAKMILPFRLWLIVLSLGGLFYPNLFAQPEIVDKIRDTNLAMALPEGRLGRVLERYFEEGLGGKDNFNRLHSLLIEGRIQVGEVTRTLHVFKKKPDFFRVRFEFPNRREWIMAYDGRAAWDQHPLRNDGKPRLLEGEELEAFKLDSAFASHLLYPLAPGKKMEFVDTVPVDGRICHQIRVTFDNGWTLIYFIDIRTFNEFKLLSYSPQDEIPRETIFEDFRPINGIPLAHKVSTRRAGELLHTVYVDRAEANMGVMPWIFEFPKD
jgi:hypothetical protein